MPHSATRRFIALAAAFALPLALGAGGCSILKRPTKQPDVGQAPPPPPTNYSAYGRGGAGAGTGSPDMGGQPVYIGDPYSGPIGSDPYLDAPSMDEAGSSLDPPAPMTGGGGYTIRKGDTLWSIAQSQLGDGKRWQEIASLNPRVDPKRLLVGTTLQMPQ